MNLQEFINLREKCPICDTALITRIDANRKQKTRIENDRHVSVMIMRGMGVNNPDYEVGYTFGYNDYSLGIEFYNEWNVSNYHTLHMMKIFKEFHNNIQRGTADFSFLRTCGFCFKYEMRTFRIDLNLEDASYSSISPSVESFIFTIPTEDEFKFIRLDNHIKWNESDLSWWRSSNKEYRIGWSDQNNYSRQLALPYIPFISKEETEKRLSTLIIFS
jgi:hypothetical protein